MPVRTPSLVVSCAVFSNPTLVPPRLFCVSVCLALQLYYVLENGDITAKAMDTSSAYYLAEATEVAGQSVPSPHSCSLLH